MEYSKRIELFRQVENRHIEFLTGMLWRLTGDKELFSEALQYSLLEMWRHVEKLKGKQAAGYVYRIALSANSKAWRNRMGRNGQLNSSEVNASKSPAEMADVKESERLVRTAIAMLPAKQAKAIVMRYLEQQGYKAIAEKLRCSEAGARSNVSKALAALKRVLKNAY